MTGATPDTVAFAAGGWARFGGDPVATARAAERLRDAGDVLEAGILLSEMCRVFPHLPYGWRERAVLRVRAGDRGGASRDFRRAFAVAPGDRLTLVQTVRHLAGSGLLDEAEACLAGFSAQSDADASEAEALAQLVDFMRLHPEAETWGFATDLRDTPRYLNSEVEMRIAGALAARAPFSLIRLGDGEGAWISEPEEAGGRFGTLYRRNRRSILRTWFGTDALIDRADFLAVRKRLLDAIGAASVVGVTYPKRIRHEYGIASFDGVPSCVNVLRHVAPLLAAPGPDFTTHDIHLNLHLTGAMHRLLGSGAPVGLIACHPGLASAIARRTGARVAASLLIPEEKGFSSVIGSNGVTPAHFPDVFERNVARLRGGDWRGMLWLVAAGYLGKIYCHEIGRNGGVAVDIGSLADAWSAKATRPGFSDLGPYVL